MKRIDARSLACPKPVILTKDAISDESTNQIEVVVDNLAALENVKRFLTNFGFEVKKVQQAGRDHHIFADRVYVTVSEPDFDVNEYPCPVPTTSAKGKTIFFKSEFLGLGDDELGALLMKAFIYTLNEVDNQPERLLFMNSSVRLCVENAITLDNLLKLEEKGVDILVCGTCLDFFGITDKLKVGKISNMYDIAGNLTNNSSVLSI
jgi:selenium metabolism protein YedF